MKYNINIVMSCLLLIGCSTQPSRFVVENNSGRNVSEAIIFKDGKAHHLGKIAPGEKKSISFDSFFESRYLLSYKIDHKKFSVQLCYQGDNLPADGLIRIKDDKAEMECR